MRSAVSSGSNDILIMKTVSGGANTRVKIYAHFAGRYKSTGQPQFTPRCRLTSIRGPFVRYILYVRLRAVLSTARIIFLFSSSPQRRQIYVLPLLRFLIAYFILLRLWDIIYEYVIRKSSTLHCYYTRLIPWSWTVVIILW